MTLLYVMRDIILIQSLRIQKPDFEFQGLKIWIVKL